MQPTTHDRAIHCSVCHRAVDDETRGRARRAFEPLIVCEACVAEAEARWFSAARLPAAA